MKRKSWLLITFVVMLGAGLVWTSRSWQTTPTNSTVKLTTTETNDSNHQAENIQDPQKGPAMKTLEDFPEIEAQEAILVTNRGEMTIKLYRQRAPLTTANFLSLAKSGFYDDLVFHRVIDDFMAQVGDPKSKDPNLKAEWGTGGPGYTIADEFHPELRHQKKGIVSMANSGPDTGGSQFFITHQATPWLDDKHADFGQVTAGLEILEQIQVGDKILKVELN